MHYNRAQGQYNMQTHPLTSFGRRPKNWSFASFCLFCSLFTFFMQKMCKKHISTSVRSAQHPNTQTLVKINNSQLLLDFDKLNLFVIVLALSSQVFIYKSFMSLISSDNNVSDQIW